MRISLDFHKSSEIYMRDSYNTGPKAILLIENELPKIDE